MKEDENELERKAVEELLKEAKRGKDRAETMGPSGWLKCPLASTNKRFLINTVKNTLPPGSERNGRTDEDDRDRRDRSRERKPSRKHGAHSYKRSHDSRKERSRSPSSSSSSKSQRKSQSKSDPKRR